MLRPRQRGEVYPDLLPGHLVDVCTETVGYISSAVGAGVSSGPPTKVQVSCAFAAIVHAWMAAAF